MSASAPELRADRSSFDRVLDALGDRVSGQVKKSGSRAQAYSRCPSHDDRKPSLSVTWTDSPRGGKTLLSCKRECDQRRIAAAMGLTLSDLFDTPPGRPDGKATTTLVGKPLRKPRAKSTSSPSSGPSSAGPWQLESEHIYADADGVPVFKVSRFRPGSPAKYLSATFDRSGTRIAARTAPAVERRVLYRLPEVVAAIRDGRPVYVCEGEKDADALTAAGATATTNPFGAADSDDPAKASTKWLPQYTAALAGAHVVLVADKDTADKGYPGYRHVLYVAGELAGVAASVRVVEARSGKDAHDHLVGAGLPLDDLVPLDLQELRQLVAALDVECAAGDVTEHQTDDADQDQSQGKDQPAELVDAASPARTAPTTTERAERTGQVLQFRGHGQDDDTTDPGRGGGDGGGGGAGGGSGDDPKWKRRVVRDRFEATPDGLFKLKFEVKDGERNITAMELLPVRVRLSARMALDLCDGEPAELSYVDLVVSRGDTEHELLAIDRRRWESCSWVGELPWPATMDNTTNGRSLLVKAITATSGDVPLTTMYGALGWQQIDGKWSYLTAAGALDADGPVEGIRIKPDPVLQRFTLSAPPVDLAELQAAIAASTLLLDAVPARIAAPLLGAAYRACLGRSQTTVMPVGGKSGGKTSLSAYTMQHYDPTARHDNMPGAGAGEEAGTLTGLEELRYRVGDMLLSLDDVAPDKGVERASSRVATIARTQYNGVGKVRGKRDGGLRAVHPPRSLPVVTGEESTTVESADSRIVLLRVTPGDVDVTTVMPALDQGEDPELRAKLIAAMVVHYASAMPMSDWIRETRERLAHAMLDPAADDPNLDKRHSGSVADLAVGWRAMLDMAAARGALSEPEAAELWDRAWAGLVDCKRRLIDGSARRTAADRMRDLLTSVFVLRRAALESKAGGVPLNPERYGWEDNPSSSFDGLSHRKVGETIGWTDGVKVWLRPGAAYPALKRQGDSEADPVTYTRNGLGEALADADVIRTRTTKDGVRRTTVSVRVGASQSAMDVWELDHAWLFPDVDDDEGDTPPAPPTAPPLPPVTRPAPEPAPAATERPSPAPTLFPAGLRSPELPDATESPSAEAVPVRDELEQQAEEPSAPGRRWHTDSAGRRKFGGLGLVAEPDAVWVVRPTARAAEPARLASTPVDLSELLDQAATLQLGHQLQVKGRNSPVDQGQVWIMPKLRRVLGWPASMDEDPTPAQRKKVQAAITAAGWRLEYAGGKASPVRFWMQVRRDDGAVLDLVVPEWFAAESEFGELHVPAKALARRLGRYAASLGVAWQWSPAVSGLQLLAATRPKLIRNGRRKMPPPAIEPTTEGRFGSRRKPTPEETRHSHVHLYDFNGLYLGASISLPVAWGEYVHEKRPVVDLKRPGYWKVALPKWEDPLLPDPFIVNGRHKGREVWVTTPTLKIAVELLDMDVQPSEGYLAAEILSGDPRDKVYPGDSGSKGYGRLLNEWAERMRDARKSLRGSTNADDAAVYSMVKETYAHGYGRFDATAIREGNHPMYRPDFRHAIMAQGRFTITQKLLRAAEATGRHPLAVWMGDSLVFTADSADPAEALPEGFTLGAELGQVSHEGAAPMEYLQDMLVNKRPGLLVQDGDTVKKLTIAEAIRFVSRGGSLETAKGEFRHVGLDAILSGGDR